MEKQESNGFLMRTVFLFVRRVIEKSNKLTYHSFFPIHNFDLPRQMLLKLMIPVLETKSMMRLFPAIQPHITNPEELKKLSNLGAGTHLGAVFKTLPHERVREPVWRQPRSAGVSVCLERFRWGVYLWVTAGDRWDSSVMHLWNVSCS